MDEDKLKAILDAEIRQASGYVASEVSAQRAKAMDYYYGEPYGNEIPDRSQVVTREVADTIGWMMPSLMRMFTSGDDIFTFEPVGPGDEQKSEQATDYVNYIFQKDNNGFLILHDWFFDALAQKNGIVKTFWEENETTTKETYEGLTDEEMALLLDDESIEPIEHTETIVQYPDPQTGQMVPVKLHDVKIKKNDKYGCVKVVNVPPEEFLISQRGLNIQDSPFVCHRTQKTRSELIEMGYERKLVEEIAADNNSSQVDSAEELARFNIDLTNPHDSENAEDAMKLVTVYECYLKTDHDDDGIAELRKITYAGKKILDNEDCDRVPFDYVTSGRIPHKFFGQSVADVVMDIQQIASTITRQLLDNMYLRNNASVFVTGEVNLDDLLNRRPGNIIRGKPGSSVMPMPAEPLGSDAYSLLQYVEQMRENRTGVSPRTQGLGQESLHDTARGESMLYSAAMGKIELIARIFAEGLKELGISILHQVCKHQQKERIIRLRDEWVPMDPREWSNQMDVTVTVGLGNSNVETQRLALQSMLRLDAEIVSLQGGVNGPILTAENIYNKLTKLVETFGWKDVDSYYTNPKNAPPQQPKPDPEMMKMQAEMQMKQQEAQSNAQLAQQQAQLTAQLEQQKMEKASQVEAMQAQADIAVKREEAQLKAQLEMLKANSQIKIAQYKARLDSRVAIQGARIRQRESRQKMSQPQRPQ